MHHLFATRKKSLDSIPPTFFPLLEARHVLDASAHFDTRWSGRNMFLTPVEFNIQIDVSAPIDAGHATHNLLIDAQVSN